MNREIKERVTMIQHGEVPEGYHYTKAGLIPDDWLPIQLAGNIFTNVSDKKHDGNETVMSVTQDFGIVPRSDIDIDIKYDEENLSGYKRIQKGDFIISLRSFQGGIEYSNQRGIVSPAYTVLKNKVPISDDYFRNYFKTNDFINRLNSATYGIRDGKQIGFQDFSTLILHYPPLNEQQRIAEILNHCDKTIDLKQQLVNQEQARKTWLLNNLLDPNSSFRISDFGGDWTQVRFGKIVKQSKTRPNEALNNSSYPRIDLESIESRTGRLLEKNLSGQKSDSLTLFNKGEVLFGKLRPYLRKVFFAPYDGLCSSEIWVLKPINPLMITNEYLYFLVQTNGFISAANTTAGTKMPRAEWSFVSKFQVSIPPTLEEQTAIANLLLIVENRINSLTQELEQWRLKKLALMQLLLTGIVRVSI